MELKLFALHTRFAVIEIDDGGKFNTKSEYEIYINGKFFKKTSRTINYIDSLLPDTEYKAEVKGEKSEIISFTTRHEFVTLNVKKFGAKSDSISDDTIFIQAAIYACPKDGRVLIPKGTYKITSLFLKSHVSIELAEGAVLLADNERYNHPIFPGMIQSYDESDEYNLGTWEGNPLSMFAGIITGVDICDTVIYGRGKINGNASFENWWHDAKNIRGAFRPRMLFLERCKEISVYGIGLENSPSWTVHPYCSEDIVLCGININNPSDSPNTDGMDIEFCKNVKIAGVDFSLGDDCIAIKSGKIYMGKKLKTPSENIIIRNCRMNDGHGAVTLGSEMSVGVRNLTVEKCFFNNTDRGLRIKTRRGRGKDSIVDNVIFKDIEMENVKVPFVVNSFYYCDPDGKSEYVQCRNALPVDDRTPYINRLVFENIECENCHSAVAFMIGLPERKIGEIVMKNVNINFSENAVSFVPAMLCGVGEMKKQGIYAENIHSLVFDNVTISGQDGMACHFENVDEVKGKVNDLCSSE